MSRTAVVQEWIAQHGGSENVAEAIAAAVPSPDIFCLWRDDKTRFSGFPVRESPLRHSAFLRQHKAFALPFMPLAWRGFDFSGYEKVIISSHLFAHHVAAAPSARNAQTYVYVHTPARYIWEPMLDERGQARHVRAASALLRRYDKAKLCSDAAFAANSEFVRQRMFRTWGVDSSVIYPPVEVAKIQAGSPWKESLNEADSQTIAKLPDPFILGASRLVRYKRLDLAIQVGVDLDLPVVIAGTGPEEKTLLGFAAEAPVPVHLIGQPSDALLYALYERASLAVFPAIEDFGIMPVEAMALGTPVLVNEVGGARESVEALGGGATTDFATSQARRGCALSAMSVDRVGMAQKALSFDTARFKAQMSRLVSDG